MSVYFLLSIDRKTKFYRNLNISRSISLLYIVFLYTQPKRNESLFRNVIVNTKKVNTLSHDTSMLSEPMMDRRSLPLYRTFHLARICAYRTQGNSICPQKMYRVKSPARLYDSILILIRLYVDKIY